MLFRSRNEDSQKEALINMAEEYISLNRKDYEKWEAEIRERTEKG